MKTTKTIRKRNRLGQFQSGKSGNPKGRPRKKHSITETIRSMMDEKPEIKKALGQRVLKMAIGGDIAAIKVVWQYLDGMPKQSTDVTSKGKRITIKEVIFKAPKNG